MSSISFSTQINNLFATIREVSPENSSIPRNSVIIANPAAVKISSVRNNSDILASTYVEQCEFNNRILQNEQTINTSEETEVIVIDSDDEESLGTPVKQDLSGRKFLTFQERNLNTASHCTDGSWNNYEPEVITIDSDDDDDDRTEGEVLRAAPPDIHSGTIRIKEEKICNTKCVMPVQSPSQFVFNKHFLSELGNSFLSPEDIEQSPVVTSSSCDFYGKTDSDYKKDNKLNTCDPCLSSDARGNGNDHMRSLAPSTNEASLVASKYQESNKEFKHIPKMSFNAVSAKSKNNIFRYFACPKCNELVRSKLSLKIHCDFYCEATAVVRKLICKNCLKPFSGPYGLQRHMFKTHGIHFNLKSIYNSGNRNSQEITGENISLSKPEMLTIHETGSDTQTLNCLREKQMSLTSHSKPDNKKFLPQKHVENGKLIFQDNKESKLNQSTDTSACNASTFVCKICVVAFSSESSLSEHLKIHLHETNAMDIHSNAISISSVNVSEKCPNTGGSLLPKSSRKIQINLKLKKSLRSTRLLNYFSHFGYSKSSRYCPICGKYVYSPSFLNVHMRKHTNEKPFSCRKCKKGFFSKVALKYHALTKCPQRSEINLESNTEECEQSVQSKIMSNCKYSEIVNKKYFPRQSRFTGNYNYNLDNTRSKTVACEKPSFSNTENLKRNRYNSCSSDVARVQKRRVACKLCRNTFSSENNLKRHIRDSCTARKTTGKITVQNSSGLQFQVETSRSSVSENSTVVNRRAYSGKNHIYNCNSCGKNFNALRYLKRHKRHICPNRKTKARENAHFVESEIVFNTTTTGRSRGKILFACGVCKRDSRYPSDLKRHIDLKHNQTKIICKPCNTNFTDFQVFKNHLIGGKPSIPYECSKVSKQLNITGKYNCKNCGLNCYSIENLKSHVRICKVLNSSDEISKKPNVLTKTVAAHTNGQTRNVSSEKKGERNNFLTCDECNETFGYPCRLQSHIDQFHSSKYNQSCKGCNVNFVDFRSYKKHLEKGRMKSGMFSCPHSKNRMNSDRNKNVIIPESPNSENILCCNVCNCKFPTLTVLVQHLQEHMMNDVVS